MRLLPRLLAAVRAVRDKHPGYPTFIPADTRPRKRPRSLYRPSELHAVSPETFNARGRTRSVLLDAPHAVAPRTRHKRAAAWARLAHNQTQRQKEREDARGVWDPARRMSDEERAWWSSPYCECFEGAVLPVLGAELDGSAHACESAPGGAGVGATIAYW
jgi:hypothetical protein